MTKRARTLTVVVMAMAVLTSRSGMASEIPVSIVVHRTAPADVSAKSEGVVAQDSQTGSHVRTEDPQLSKVIRQGVDQSPTFRELMNRIDSLSGFVYVVWSRCGTRLWEPGACLDHHVAVSGGVRFLRVNIYPGESGERLLALIAHELQHALEVLSDNNATSQENVAKLYERIGLKRRAADNFETEAAGRVQDAVYREARERARTR
jgi:hypothetical protein